VLDGSLLFQFSDVSEMSGHFLLVDNDGLLLLSCFEELLGGLSILDGVSLDIYGLFHEGSLMFDGQRFHVSGKLGFECSLISLVFSFEFLVLLSLLFGKSSETVLLSSSFFQFSGVLSCELLLLDSLLF